MTIFSIQNKKKVYIIISVFGVLVLVALGAYIYFLGKTSTTNQNQLAENQQKITHSPCLGDDETADFISDENFGFKYPKFPVVIVVRNKDTGKEKFSFPIDDVSSAYHPLELYKCNIYVIKEFNYDRKRLKPLNGYKVELWKYDYNGTGGKILDFYDYSYDFRVDPTEIYIALIRGGYVERPDYALVIKNLNSQNNDFELFYQSLLKEHPDILGTFGLRTWTKKGDYFWADVFAGAAIDAFLRISRNDWKVDVLRPFGVSSVTVNWETGYATYDTGPGWIGIDIVKEQVYDEWRKEGKKIDFYVYNLFTKEKTLLATIDDPAWSFKPQWISDTELQYEVPSGEKKIYKINE
jgi:hypothetical protein